MKNTQLHKLKKQPVIKNILQDQRIIQSQGKLTTTELASIIASHCGEYISEITWILTVYEMAKTDILKTYKDAIIHNTTEDVWLNRGDAITFTEMLLAISSHSPFRRQQLLTVAEIFKACIKTFFIRKTRLIVRGIFTVYPVSWVQRRRASGYKMILNRDFVRNNPEKYKRYKKLAEDTEYQSLPHVFLKFKISSLFSKELKQTLW